MSGSEDSVRGLDQDVVLLQIWRVSYGEDYDYLTVNDGTGSEVPLWEPGEAGRVGGPFEAR